MGNTQFLIENMNDNDKLEFLIKEGFLNDEIIQLFRSGIMTSKDIQNYIFDLINITSTEKKKIKLH